MAQRSTMTVLQLTAWATLLCAGLAWGQIYKWVDGGGQVHFTDDPSRIPPESRTRATVYGTSSPAAPSAPSAPGEDVAIAPDTVTVSPGQAPAELRDRLGRGPEYWRGLARKWAATLQRQLAERERLQMLYSHTRNLADDTRDVRDRGRLEAEIERLGQTLADVDRQIQEVQTMLRTTLPLQAVQLGADPEWLKEPPVQPR